MTDSAPAMYTASQRLLAGIAGLNGAVRWDDDDFGNLTALTAQLLQAPFACVRLIQRERNWFECDSGIAALSAPVLPFCPLVVQEGCPLIVADASADIRFRDHPLILNSPAVRFYAGAPLISTSGEIIGTLCAFDHNPHTISAQQLQMLQRLAQQVVTELELRCAVATHEPHDDIPRTTRTGAGAGLEQEPPLPEHKLLDADLQQNLERFRVASDAAGLGFWQFDVGSGTLTWDDWMYRIYGRQRIASAEVYETWASSLYPEDRERCEALAAAAIRGEAEFAAEYRIVRPGGDLRYIHAASHTVRAADGSVLQLTGVNIDVTERRCAELKLLETSSLLRTVLDSASAISIIATDPNLTIKVFNSGAEKLLGYTSQEVIGLVTPIAFHDEEELRSCGLELASKLGYAVEDRAVFAKPPMLGKPREWTYIRKDLTRITVSLIVNAMHSESGELIGYVCVAQDVTRRNEFEESLRAAMAKAEQASVAKSEFLANMSHEIRTPLNAVIGLGYLLEQTSLTDDQRQFLSKIQFAGRSLLSVVNNVLDLSKIEAGEIALEDEPFNLPELLRDISQMLAPQAASKGIALMSETSCVPRAVRGDAVRLRQVLTNLVSNAIKFTETGQVEVLAFCTEQTSEQIRLRCEIKDTGIGIAADTIERLFSPFAQADASTTRRFGGTGLGLSIARRCVELMAGSIGVVSELDAGSTFWFEIPLRLADGLEDKVGGEAGSLRIMIGDPDAQSSESVCAAARAFGWNPHVIETGQHLIEELKGADAEFWPDLLILRRQLPDMEAPQLLARLRQQCTRTELPPVIILADATPALAEPDSGMLGVDMLLARPVLAPVLFNAVNAVLSKRWGGQARVLQSTNFGDVNAQWLPGVRVLVVDDSEVNQDVARRILMQQGAVVVTCSDGVAAVEYVRAHHVDLDMVLMDVQMPLLDGNAAASIIRRDLQLDRLPIIALTAGALVAERNRSLDAGMNDVVTKPFDPQALIRKVRRLVEEARGALLPMLIVERHASGDTRENALPSCIDPGVVQQMFGNDLPLFRSLLGRVLNEYQDLALSPVKLPENAAACSDLEMRTHRLKGSAGMLGAKEVRRCAGSVESALQEQRPPATIEQLLQQLAAALHTLGEQTRSLLQEPGSPVEPTPPAPAPEACAGELDELCFLLETQNLEALDKFSAMAPSLSAMLGARPLEAMRAAIQNLEFAAGAQLLRTAMIADDECTDFVQRA
jgi:PAS domain S-box-containing protein